MNYDNPVIFDFETSSPDPFTCEVIQMAALAPLTNDKFEVKVQFDEARADKHALKLNKYSAKNWKEAIPVLDALEEFFTFLKEHTSIKKISQRGNTFYIAAGMGFNLLRFDLIILTRLAQYHSLYLPMDYRPFDVMQLALWYLQELDSYSLVSLAKYFKCYRKDAHDAMADVEMTADVATCILYDEEDEDENPRWMKRRWRSMKRRRKKK